MGLKYEAGELRDVITACIIKYLTFPGFVINDRSYTTVIIHHVLGGNSQNFLDKFVTFLETLR
jgi:hypothetical protein